MSQETQASGSGNDAVKSQLDASLLEEAGDEGIDVDAVIDEKLTKHDGYSAGTVANFVESDLRRQIEAERAEVIKGIIMGSRDRYGENWPRRHSLVRSSAEHLEVSAWGSSLPGPGGDDVKIPVGGCAVTLRCSYEQEYDSYQGERIDAVREMDRGELVEAMEAVSVSPDFLSRDDEYEVVVVKGEIRFVNPQTVFEGDDKEDWYDGAVMMDDNRGELQPHLELSLARSGQTQLRGHLERQKNGRPFIQVPDFLKLVHDAYQDRESPEDQARFVGEGLRGKEVYFVGNVNSFNTNRSDDGEVTHYVDVGLTALVSAEDAEQPTLEESAVSEEEVEAEGAAADAVEGEISAEPADPQAASKEPAAVEQARDDIDQYADLVNVDVGELTFADIDENLDLDYPDAAIKAALGEYDDEDVQDDESADGSADGSADAESDFDRGDVLDADYNTLRGYAKTLDGVPGSGISEADLRDAILEEMGWAPVSDESDADEADDGAESDDGEPASPFDLVKDGDTYHCPAPDPDNPDEDCIFNAGSTGELAGHIFDDHGAQGDPAEWVAGHLEG